MKRLAIIPARGGSNRILKKNIKKFCGKPMISYPIRALKESGLFHTIHVSTDSSEIAELVSDLGLEVDFLRDSSLADDHTPIMPVLKWTLEQYRLREIYFEEVAAVMPCTPFIESSDYIKANKLLNKENNDKPVIGISSYPAPIEWAFDKNEFDNSLTPVNPGLCDIRSQDLKKKYYDAGAFVFYHVNHILNYDLNSIDANYIGLILDKIKGIDIDEEEDWDFAETIMKSILNKK